MKLKPIFIGNKICSKKTTINTRILQAGMDNQGSKLCILRSINIYNSKHYSPNSTEFFAYLVSSIEQLYYHIQPKHVFFSLKISFFSTSAYYPNCFNINSSSFPKYLLKKNLHPRFQVMLFPIKITIDAHPLRFNQTQKNFHYIPVHFVYNNQIRNNIRRNGIARARF